MTGSHSDIPIKPCSKGVPAASASWEQGFTDRKGRTLCYQKAWAKHCSTSLVNSA